MSKIIVSSFKDKNHQRVFATKVTNYIFGEPEEEVLTRSSLKLLMQAVVANKVDNQPELFWYLLPESYLRAHKRENPSYVADYYLPYNSL